MARRPNRTGASGRSRARPGRRSRAAAPRAGGLRRFVTGSALLAVGICGGVLLGSILDGPRVLVRRWTEEVRTLELAAPRPTNAGMRLEEFEALQTPSPEPPPAEQAAVAPPVEEVPPAVAARPEPAPKTKPEKSAPAPTPAAARDARSLIAEIKSRQGGAGAPRAAVQTSVVQVAAYKDAASADALVASLRRVGFDSYVSRSAPGGPQKFRVRVRPKGDKGIDTLASKLELRGYRTWVTKEGASQ